MRTLFCAFACVILYPAGSFAAPVPRDTLPQPLPAAVVEAWEKAGAEVGWQPADGSRRYYSFAAQPGDVPLLRLHQMPPGGLASLPAPNRPFAIELSRTNYGENGLKELKRFEYLHTLSLGGTKVTDADLDQLAGFKDLQSLNLAYSKVTDAGLKHLAGLKRLRHLNLTAAPITDAGAKQLAAFTELQSLDLSGSRVTKRGLTELAALPHLSQLALRRTDSEADVKSGFKYDADVMAALKELKHLRALDIDSARLTPAALKSLGELTELRSLRFRPHEPREMAALSPLTRLESLYVVGGDVTGDGLKFVANLTELRELYAVCCHVSGGLVHLAKLSKLEYLNLCYSWITDADVRHLGGLSKLRTLLLADNKHIGDDALQHIAGLKELEALNVSDTKVTGAGMKHLAGLTRLRYLNLQKTGVDDDGLQQLTTLKRLEDLQLESTQITDAGLSHLTALPELRSLTLRYIFVRITDDGLKYLAGVKSLRSLDVSGTRTTKEGREELRKALPGCKVVTTTE